jgi:SAM-dependent methyltransferase
MLAFGLTIFWGAFLLFLVQPLIAKFILPWFGGSPAVWTTCMLFFQILLLGGYAYAHFSISRLKSRQQVILHLALLAVALALLPITPGDHWKPLDGANPTGRILFLLLGCLGLPYLVLAATGPLFQAWFSEAHPGVSPYRLYALSNVGSLLALVSYPFLVEPNLTRHFQAGWWSAGLMIFAVLAFWCGFVVWKRAAHEPARSATTEEEAAEETGSTTSRWLWFALPACGVVLLLAVTNKICQDIAVIPFLWVLPLSLYLLTFIISFDSPRWYWRPLWLPALALALLAVLWLMLGDHMTAPTASWLKPVAWLLNTADNFEMFTEITIYLGVLFVCCLVCHGEVYRLRPTARQLTGYYLSISAGGACGGLFVAILAPLIFKNYFELHVGLFLVAALILVLLFRDTKSPLHNGQPKWAWVLLVLALPAIGGTLYYDALSTVKDAKELSRNFYGVLKVFETYPDEPELHKLTLQHGGTTHGLQFMSDHKRRLPSSYYTSSSGIGRLMKNYQPEGGRKVAVVGLGTGSLAVWGRTGDHMRFYEINTEVERIARDTFFYLKDTAAKTEIVLGDARLSLEREPDQNYDIIALDAFSSDAIPVHLITREAFEIYLRHLKPGGVIAVHISNRYLNLEPIVMRIAQHFGLTEALVDDNDVDEREEDEESSGAYSSDWVLLSKDAAFLNRPPILDASYEPGIISDKVRLWTDEKSDLLRILLVDEDSFLGWLQKL